MEKIKLKVSRELLVQILDVLKEVPLKGITEARAVVNLYDTITDIILAENIELELNVDVAQTLYYILVRMRELSEDLVELKNKLKKLEWR